MHPIASGAKCLVVNCYFSELAV